MHIVVETERMVLRRFTEQDARPLAALYGDPQVMRFITLQPPSLAEVESTILPAYLREYGELADGLGSFAAIEKATGEMAGRFSLKPANSYGLAGGTELGYRLYPAFWGRGLATEGARALIGSAFGRLRLDLVVATTMAGNVGSWRVLEKCGMPTTLTRNGGKASVSKATRLSATQYKFTIKFTFTVGNDGYSWLMSGCAKDAVTKDGIGLPGTHSCGASKISTSIPYLG